VRFAPDQPSTIDKN
jgi:hypothetical protein